MAVRQTSVNLVAKAKSSLQLSPEGCGCALNSYSKTGAFNSREELVEAGLLPGAEGYPGGRNPWLVSTAFQRTQDFRVVGDAFNYLMPQPSSNVFTDRNWDTSPALTVDRAKIFDATNPDLSGFIRRGGKLIVYHGCADLISNSLVNSLTYYQNVINLMPQARAFLAYSLIPGMGYCGGGAQACSIVDWVTPPVNWVERGFSRSRSRVQLLTGPEQGRSAGIRYLKNIKADINNAENFVCASENASNRVPGARNGRGRNSAPARPRTICVTARKERALGTIAAPTQIPWVAGPVEMGRIDGKLSQQCLHLLLVDALHQLID